MAEVLDNIRIVLVGTLYSGNVGSVCRAMANMGIRDLVLAGPQICDGWEDAVKLAVHATDILEARRETACLADAVADCAFVVGTTARGGLYRQHVKTPREVAPELLKLAASAEDVRGMHGQLRGVLPAVADLRPGQHQIADAHVCHRPAHRAHVAAVQRAHQHDPDIVRHLSHRLPRLSPKPY